MATELYKKGPELPIQMRGLHVEITPGRALHESEKYLKTNEGLGCLLSQDNRGKEEKGKKQNKKSQSRLGHHIGLQREKLMFL